jgi:hypothetical protein
VIIVETKAFTTRIVGLFSDDEYRALQLELVERPSSERIVMLFAYAKNESDDLTAAQRQALRKIIEAEYP